MSDSQTHFVTTTSPAHYGNQGYLHQDKNVHLAFPNGGLIRPPVAGFHHQPLTGQTSLNDFMLTRQPGIG